MGETREQFLKRMEDKNNRTKELLKNHACLSCSNLDYWDWYRCKLGNHSTKDGFLNMRPYKNCGNYKKRDVDWFWGLRDADLDKFYPQN